MTIGSVNVSTAGGTNSRPAKDSFGGGSVSDNPTQYKKTLDNLNHRTIGSEDYFLPGNPTGIDAKCDHKMARRSSHAYEASMPGQQSMLRKRYQCLTPPSN
jgi:hypothetical protein